MEKMVDAGMNVVRLNFAFGDHKVRSKLVSCSVCNSVFDYDFESLRCFFNFVTVARYLRSSNEISPSIEAREDSRLHA